MELQEFVTETLLTIIQGVQTAQASAGQYGARINPGLGISETIQPIEFDLAVSVFEGDKKQAGIHGLLQVIGANVQGQSQYDITSIQHIKFTIPVVFPYQPK